MSHKRIWKCSVMVLTLSLIILSLSACGQNDQQGHDTYYSSNVKPQFTPNYPSVPEENSMSMNNTSTVEAQNRARNGTMMNGQAMNDQQRRIMDEVLKVSGVNDATIIVNDKHIIVGIDVNNVGQRARVVNEVENMLHREHDGYQVSVTAERAMYDRIRMLRDEESADNVPVENFMYDLQALLKDIGNTVTEPLR